MWRHRLAKVGSAVVLAAGMYLGAMYLAQDHLIFMKPRYNHEDEAEVNYFMSHDAFRDRSLLQLSVTQEKLAAPWKLAQVSQEKESRFAYLLTPDQKYEQAFAAESLRNDTTDNGLQLWVFMGGNAQTALSWLMMLHKHIQLAARHGTLTQTRREAYLLIDYPGYGQNSGKPAAEAITSDALVAIERAVEYLKEEYPSLTAYTAHQPLSMGFFGHSIGCAAVLNVAAALELKSVLDSTSTTEEHKSIAKATVEDTTDSATTALLTSKHTPEMEITKVVLSAPFTSLLEMAQKVVGRIPFLGLLLRHNFDNRSSLDIFLTNRAARAGAAPLKLHIVHGTRDEICPHSMGVELSEYAERLATDKILTSFTPVRGGDHNSILYYHWDVYMSKMHTK